MEALARSSQDPWVEQQLRFDVSVYEQAYRAGQGNMPQMVVGSNVAIGIYPRPDLLRLVERNLGLKAPVLP